MQIKLVSEGYDPTLGIMHYDREGAPAFVFDMMEPGLTPPPHDWVGNDGKGIYFDSIDNSAYILGKEQHSARTSWVYVDGETFYGVRADIGGDPKEPWLQHSVEIPLHGEGLVARRDGEPGRLRRAIQPHHGSL